MSLIELIISLLWAIAITLFVWSKWPRPEKDAYGEWLASIREDNPDYKPPYIMGPAGKYVANPAFVENQIIIHKS